MDAKKLTNSAMMIAIAVVITILGLYIPPLFLLLFLIPVPIAIAGIRGSNAYAIAASIVVFMVNMIFADIITASITLSFCFIGAFMGYLINKKRKAADTVFETILVSIFSLIAVLYIINMAFKINIIEEFLQMFKTNSSEIMSLFGSSVDSLTIKNAASMFEEMARLSLPASIIITIALFVAINYIVIAKVLKSQGVSIDMLPPFRDWRMPYITGWIFVTALIYQYFSNGAEIVSTNIIILLSIGFTISGMALIKYYMTYKMKIKSALSSIVLVLLFVFPITSWLLTIIGVADTSINLRKYMLKG